MFVSEGGEEVQVRNERCSFQGRQKTFATTPKRVPLYYKVYSTPRYDSSDCDSVICACEHALALDFSIHFEHALT